MMIRNESYLLGWLMHKLQPRLLCALASDAHIQLYVGVFIFQGTLRIPFLRGPEVGQGFKMIAAISVACLRAERKERLRWPGKKGVSNLLIHINTGWFQVSLLSTLPKQMCWCYFSLGSSETTNLKIAAAERVRSPHDEPPDSWSKSANPRALHGDVQSNFCPARQFEKLISGEPV